jgi:16S rRNA (guanine(966)-N(2))-methyltransferase RsmD
MTLKITGGLFKGRKLYFPPPTIRPTQNIVRQAVFNICQQHISDASFLDVFSGSGIMGIEAISRGANFVAFIDNNFQAISCIKKNISALNMQNKTLPLLSDVSCLKKKLKSLSFDIVYIDPPYDLYQHSFHLIEQLIQDLIDENILKFNGHLFLEEPVKNKNNIIINGLTTISKRPYGSTRLVHFIRK